MKALNVPGYQNSGENHWQTHWENELNWLVRVQMSDWENPQRDDWVNTLEKEILSSDEDLFLVAHSLGCTTIAHLSQKAKEKVKGAFIVSNPDLENNDTLPECLYTFTPIPRVTLPFPSLMIASTNDPYCPVEAANTFAKSWGSELVLIGEKGHISGADVENWPEGKQRLLDFFQHIEADDSLRQQTG